MRGGLEEDWEVVEDKSKLLQEHLEEQSRQLECEIRQQLDASTQEQEEEEEEEEEGEEVEEVVIGEEVEVEKTPTQSVIKPSLEEEGMERSVVDGSHSAQVEQQPLSAAREEEEEEEEEEGTKEGVTVGDDCAPLSEGKQSVEQNSTAHCHHIDPNFELYVLFGTLASLLLHSLLFSGPRTLDV